MNNILRVLEVKLVGDSIEVLFKQAPSLQAMPGSAVLVAIHNMKPHCSIVMSSDSLLMKDYRKGRLKVGSFVAGTIIVEEYPSTIINDDYEVVGPTAGKFHIELL